MNFKDAVKDTIEYYIINPRSLGLVKNKLTPKYDGSFVNQEGQLVECACAIGRHMPEKTLYKYKDSTRAVCAILNDRQYAFALKNNYGHLNVAELEYIQKLHDEYLSSTSPHDELTAEESLKLERYWIIDTELDYMQVLERVRFKLIRNICCHSSIPNNETLQGKLATALLDTSITSVAGLIDAMNSVVSDLYLSLPKMYETLYITLNQLIEEHA